MEAIMDPADDALYRVHQTQATRRGLSPLPYEQFCEQLRGQTDTDLTQLLTPRAGVRIPGGGPPRFALGTLCITPTAATAIPAPEVLVALAHHVAGDWGRLSPDDWLENERALVTGGRLMSVYDAADGRSFYVITEADRSVTTVLLPEDY
ncbi:MAG: hypothetical protein ACYDC1_19825 [Limisphaerales bacterium]